MQVKQEAWKMEGKKAQKASALYRTVTSSLAVTSNLLNIFQIRPGNFQYEIPEFCEILGTKFHGDR